MYPLFFGLLTINYSQKNYCDKDIIYLNHHLFSQKSLFLSLFAEKITIIPIQNSIGNAKADAKSIISSVVGSIISVLLKI
jgi:hypothetical protein